MTIRRWIHRPWGLWVKRALGLDPEVDTGSRRNQIYADGADLPAMENRVETDPSLTLMS